MVHATLSGWLQKGQQKLVSSFGAGFFRDAILELIDLRFAISISTRSRDRSAAYGSYLAATNASLPRGYSERHVEKCDYEPWEEEYIRWQAVRVGSGDDVVLRNVAGHLRANRRYISVDEFNSIGTMMHWVVERIPARDDTPRLAAPTGLRLRVAVAGGTVRAGGRRGFRRQLRLGITRIQGQPTHSCGTGCRCRVEKDKSRILTVHLFRSVASDTMT
ncbi:hypothetical protein ZWY2020_021700 [Hordeum vulgare]|nr:hypothetical protein ZWY2020_021700 [Hordeum vulgare]